MPVRTRVGNAALFLTQYPERDDIIIEAHEDDGMKTVYLVAGMYIVHDNALGMFRDDLEAEQLNWEYPE